MSGAGFPPAARLGRPVSLEQDDGCVLPTQSLGVNASHQLRRHDMALHALLPS